MGVIGHETMKNANIFTVFECVRKHGSITKKKIQKITGLSWGSISNITSLLLEKDIFIERLDPDAGVGRTPVLLDINTERYSIIGIEISLDGISGVVIDLKGRELVKKIEAVAAISMYQIIEQIKELIHWLIENSGGKDNIQGLGVAMPSFVDMESGVLEWAPQLGMFSAINMQEILYNEFGIEVIIENNANCLALNEMMFGELGDVQNMLFIMLSHGIGMGIVINGKIFRGMHGASGEIGHNIMNPAGPKCVCGKYGCLETYASGDVIINRAKENLEAGYCTTLCQMIDSGNDIDLDNIMAAAASGDDSIVSILQQATLYTSVALANAVNMFDPELVVFSGVLSEYEEQYITPIVTTANDLTYRKKKIEAKISNLRDFESAAKGAASLFIQKVFLNVIE